MFKAKKIPIPDVPPKRSTRRFEALRNWLRLSLLPLGTLTAVRQPGAEKRSSTERYPLRRDRL